MEKQVVLNLQEYNDLLRKIELLEQFKLETLKGETSIIIDEDFKKHSYLQWGLWTNRIYIPLTGTVINPSEELKNLIEVFNKDKEHIKRLNLEKEATFEQYSDLRKKILDYNNLSGLERMFNKLEV